MATLAVLHPSIESQLQNQHPTESRHLRLVCAAQTLEEFESELSLHSAQVIILDLAVLGDFPAPIIQRLQTTHRPELVIVIYAYATRAQLASLDLPNVKLLRAPVSLSLLRASMMSLIARDLFGSSSPLLPSESPLTPVARSLRDAVRSLLNLTDSISNVPPQLAPPALNELAHDANLTRFSLEQSAKQLGISPRSESNNPSAKP